MERSNPNPLATESLRNKILPLRERAGVQNRWLSHRLDTVLPEIMRREGFDMWVVAGREYNEDPVLLTLLPAPALYARRRTVLVFHLRPNGSLERLSIRAGSTHDGWYRPVWNEAVEEQWEAVARVARERDAKCIGINVSPVFAFGDGLSHAEYEQMVESFGPDLLSRTRGAERLCVGWLERRTEAEIEAYPGIVSIVHDIIAEAFSRAVIHPGVTTFTDVAWLMRQRMHDLGLEAWFQPSVSGQRRGDPAPSPDGVILPGDLLHCDIGFYYLGLATDCQQMAYVRHLGEHDAPTGLHEVLRAGNRLQDILAAECLVGRTGNEILAASLDKMKREGIDGSIYTHPIGYHGHGAGPTIGLYDHQEGVPGRGDYELHNDTCHAMELNAKARVPEWGGQEARAALEEDIVIAQGRVVFLDGRQTRLHLV